MPAGLPIPDPTLAITAWTVVLIACAVGCLTDLKARRLPNALTLSLWVSGLVFSTVTGGIAGFGGAFLASIILAIPYIILFICAGGGAGDAKMLAGIGAWLGLSHGLFALVAIALVGGIAGLAYSFARGHAGRTLGHLSTATTGFIGLAFGRLSPGECLAFMPPSGGTCRIPYGVAILLGAASAFVGAQLWHA